MQTNAQCHLQLNVALNNVFENIWSKKQTMLCQRCKVNEGNLIHMLWSCPHLDVFWKFIITTVSDVVESEIPADPRIWILGDISLVNVNFHKKYLISLAGTAGKKIILVNWKADNCPSQRHWLNELTSYCTPEKILYNVRRRPETFNKIWGSFLNALPSISPLGWGYLTLYSLLLLRTLFTVPFWGGGWAWGGLGFSFAFSFSCLFKKKKWIVVLCTLPINTSL